MTKDNPPLIYLDHGATSFPKAPGVAEAMSSFINSVGASPGRSSHKLAVQSSRLFFRCRAALCSLFDYDATDRVIFTAGITESINTVLFSLLRNHDSNHIVTTAAEHNALMRPLRYLESTFGLEITQIPTDHSGQIRPKDITAAIRDNTRLVALLHGSNVTGCVRDLAAINNARGSTPLLLDSAQTAGVVPISLRKTPVDYFCFAGHKGLLGPQGIGGLILGPDVDLRPLYFGGTGSDSEAEIQPSHYPDKIESGTPNAPGVAGLKAAVDWIQKKGVDSIFAHEQELTVYLVEKLSSLPQIQIVGYDKNNLHLPTLSTLFLKHTVSEAAFTLDRKCNIAIRMGLHCAPSSHEQLGTFPEGTARFSAGPFTTKEDIDEAISRIAREFS